MGKHLIPFTYLYILIKLLEHYEVRETNDV